MAAAAQGIEQIRSGDAHGAISLPLHFAGVDLGADVQRHPTIRYLRVGLFHRTDQRGAGFIGRQVLLKGLQKSTRSLRISEGTGR